jgi:hypothetical protein
MHHDRLPRLRLGAIPLFYIYFLQCRDCGTQLALSICGGGGALRERNVGMYAKHYDHCNGKAVQRPKNGRKASEQSVLHRNGLAENGVAQRPRCGAGEVRNKFEL